MRKARFGITFKSVSAIVFWLVLFSLIVINVGYVGFTDAIIQQCRAGAFRIAETAALDIDADALEAIREAGSDSEGYQRLYDRLSALRHTSGAEAIEVIRPDPADFGEVTVLFSAADPDGGPAPDEAYREKYRQLYEHEADRAAVTVYDNKTQPSGTSPGSPPNGSASRRSSPWRRTSRPPCCPISFRPSRTGRNLSSTPSWTRRERSAGISTTSSWSTTTTCAW